MNDSPRGRFFGKGRAKALGMRSEMVDVRRMAVDEKIGTDRRRPRRLPRALFAAIVLVALGAGAYLAGGFVRFAQEVASLDRPGSIEGADGIVVLTGGAERIEQALALLQKGEGRRLLISGVNPGTGVRSLSRITGIDEALFDCCVDLDHAALDTIGNAEMTARWAKEHAIETIVLVTSDYHIPRSLIELAGIEGAPRVVPYPVSPEKLWRSDGWPTRLGLRLLVTEYAKVLLAKARLATGIDYDRSGLGERARPQREDDAPRVSMSSVIH